MQRPPVRRGSLRWRLWTWWSARLDARRGIPSTDARGLSETEQQIQAAVNLSIRDLEQQYARQADPLRSQRARLRDALDRTYEPEYDKLQERTGRRDSRTHLPIPVHLFLLLLLTAGETAFNLVAFNVFQEPAYYTALMALAVSVAIPICAWTVGVWVRQWPAPWWKTALKATVVTGVLVAVLLGINQVRIAYLREQAAEFVSAHPELSQAFFAVNIVILVAAMLVTYLAHDPEPGFVQAKRRVEQGIRRLRQVEGALDGLGSALRTDAEIAKEAGWQLMAYYRMVNRRRRKDVPRYFDDPTNRFYRPEFVEVGVGQYHEAPSRRAAVEVLEPRRLPGQTITIEDHRPLLLPHPGTLHLLLRWLLGSGRRW